ncbi:meiotic recombination protein REC114 isoform X3 [Apodemus sylvaticus]|uniref:meiotic recombination protein REC114 isoform X3 n=1 Tax=Apodemus sylvaticus TaxID=10129 RepID=UPI002244679D|nr:meiotic recombination protein REC114 isoform X3 [Apodemus sylvaticus]
MAEAGNVASGLGLPGEVSQWPLKRYGRFMLLDNPESPGPSSEAEAAHSPTWKVFESSEESGCLVLTIVVSGHFFISQGQTLLNKSRMFRIQFSGESKEAALEHCCGCVQSLAQYVTVQEPDSTTQELQKSPGPREAGESQGKDPLQQGVSAHNADRQAIEHKHSPQQHLCMAAGTGSLQERTSVTHLAQSILAPEKLTLAYEGSSWGTEELGPFLRLCLMDQNFPAFVEEVEKELKKITGLKN